MTIALIRRLMSPERNGLPTAPESDHVLQSQVDLRDADPFARPLF